MGKKNINTDVGEKMSARYRKLTIMTHRPTRKSLLVSRARIEELVFYGTIHTTKDITDKVTN
jgi:hypothetical protein